MTHATDEHPVEADGTVQHPADEETVHDLLEDGPHGPQGRVAMAAAGIDVDRKFPADAEDEHPNEAVDTDAPDEVPKTHETLQTDEDAVYADDTTDAADITDATDATDAAHAEDATDTHPDEAYVEEGNRWSGDNPVPVAGQTLATDPSHPEDPELVVIATPDAPVETAAAAGLPVVKEPLLTADAEQEFLSRWNGIQVGFVEDPAQSVRNADALLEDISGAYVTAIGERRDALAASWKRNDAGTEELRLALRQYRSFLGVVLPK